MREENNLLNRLISVLSKRIVFANFEKIFYFNSLIK
jgi:hypothetical protein